MYSFVSTDTGKVHAAALDTVTDAAASGGEVRSYLFVKSVVHDG